MVTSMLEPRSGSLCMDWGRRLVVFWWLISRFGLTIGPVAGTAADGVVWTDSAAVGMGRMYSAAVGMGRVDGGTRLRAGSDHGHTWHGGHMPCSVVTPFRDVLVCGAALAVICTVAAYGITAAAPTAAAPTLRIRRRFVAVAVVVMLPIMFLLLNLSVVDLTLACSSRRVCGTPPPAQSLV